MSTILSGLILSSTFVSADDVVDEVNITVPVSCSMSGIGMDSHDATINNGTYNSAIGETTINAFCNDNEGFAIYAVGFTDDEPGKNVLTSSSLGSTYDITTGTATSGNDSNWAMKLSATSGTYTPIIAGSTADTEKESGDPDFTSFQAVPNKYTKVAYRTSGTDIGASAEGSTLTTTYQAYISPNQPAGTYAGQVKYTLIHPHDADAPITNPAVLDTGKTVNAKLKSLAATVVNGEEVNVAYNEDDNYIKSISVHLETSTPVGFIPSEKNTVSSPTSEKPIYIIFDNTDDTGTMHFYTEGEKIFLPSDSSQMFFSIKALTDLSALSNWDSSNVTNMGGMFANAGYSATNFNLNLSNWNTSSVIQMTGMFANAGYSATNFNLILSYWDASSVTQMDSMFANAGYSATNFNLNLSNWDTSSVTQINGMFSGTGHSAATFILDLSSWDTSSVTQMSGMFIYTGYSATTWSVTIPQTNGGGINNTTSNLYGQTASTYATPDSGKSFTLAQP